MRRNSKRRCSIRWLMISGIALASLLLCSCESSLENWSEEEASTTLPTIYVHFRGESTGTTPEGHAYWRVSLSWGSQLLSRLEICVRVCKDTLVEGVGETVSVVDTCTRVFRASADVTRVTEDFVFSRISLILPSYHLSPCVESSSAYGCPVVLSTSPNTRICLGKGG